MKDNVPLCRKDGEGSAGGWARQGCGAVWLLPIKMPVSPGCPPPLPGHRAGPRGCPQRGDVARTLWVHAHTHFIFIF